MNNHTRLVAMVAALTAVIPGVEAFAKDVVDKLRAGANDADFDPDALADEIEADTQRLSHAIIANTPAANTEPQVDPAVLAEVTAAGESQTASDSGTSATQTEDRMTTPPQGGDGQQAIPSDSGIAPPEAQQPIPDSSQPPVQPDQSSSGQDQGLSDGGQVPPSE